MNTINKTEKLRENRRESSIFLAPKALLNFMKDKQVEQTKGLDGKYFFQQGDQTLFD